MNEYYGAPNDFRAYIAHRMNEHDDPTVHKARKETTVKNKSSNKQQETITANQNKQLRSEFGRIALQFAARVTTSRALQSLKMLYQRCKEIFDTAKAEDRWLTLQESQTIQNFIDKYNSATKPSTSSNSSRWD